jgi:hypothetical protein
MALDLLDGLLPSSAGTVTIPKRSMPACLITAIIYTKPYEISLSARRNTLVDPEAWQCLVPAQEVSGDHSNTSFILAG